MKAWKKEIKSKLTALLFKIIIVVVDVYDDFKCRDDDDDYIYSLKYASSPVDRLIKERNHIDNIFCFCSVLFIYSQSWVTMEMKWDHISHLYIFIGVCLISVVMCSGTF